jgi:hypothetical protein
MKGITTCASLLLILAIGCDDNNEAIELDDASNQSRWSPEEGTLKTGENESVKRAGHLVKAHRATTRFTKADVLNPFIREEAVGSLLPNCSIVKSTEIESYEGSCANMPDQGYELDIVGCEFDGGDSFTGTVFVSTGLFLNDALITQLEGNTQAFADHLIENDDWYIDVQIESDEGNIIEACGVANTSNRKNSSSVLLTISHPSETIGTSEKAIATYEANAYETRRGSQFTKVQSELTLVSADAPKSEIERLRTRGLYPSSSLLPQHGTAEYRGQGMGNIRFNSREFEENAVGTKSPLTGPQIITIPNL